MICIAIDNGSDNTVGESYYSAHQAVGKFVKHHLDMVSCVHCKCQMCGLSCAVTEKFEEFMVFNKWAILKNVSNNIRVRILQNLHQYIDKTWKMFTELK